VNAIRELARANFVGNIMAVRALAGLLKPKKVREYVKNEAVITETKNLEE
tara:strand:- start:572 stop:721 length:150 start_codon:yes stop_codon:yes gene_type:complete